MNSYLSLLIITLTTLTFASHCGHSDHHEVSHQPNPPAFSQIILATAEEIAQGQVVENEYLVAFRQDPTPNTIHLDFEDTVWQKNTEYYNDFVDTGLAENIHLLSTIPSMAHLDDGSIQLSHQTTIPYFRTEDFTTIPNRAQVEISLIKFASATRAQRVLAHLFSQKKIWFAEPNRIVNTQQTSDTTCSSIEGGAQQLHCKLQKYQNVTNYHITNTKINQALDYIARQPNNVLARIARRPPVIAILDSGVDVRHPALLGRAADLTQLSSSNACGDHQRGCRVELDVESADFPKGVLGDGLSYPIGTSDHGERCDPKIEKCGHGTQAASLAVGFAPDLGIYGACPFCQFIAVKIALGTQIKKSKPGGIRTDAIIRGLQFVSLFRHNDNYVIRVVNNSHGSQVYSRSIAMLTRTLSSNKHKGMVIVGAAGNEDSSYRAYPAGYGSVISVANIDQKNKKHISSNYGKWIDISAPGDKLRVATPGNDSASMTGTSFSAPIVSGVAGLLLALHPEADAKHISNVLLNTADDSIYSSDVNPDYHQVTTNHENLLLLGKGIVDAERAVKNVFGDPSNPYFRYRVNGCSSLGMTPIHSPKFKLSTPPTHNSVWWFIMIFIILLPGLQPLYYYYVKK